MSQGPFESLLALDAQLRLLRVDLATEAATRWKGLMVRVGSESLLVPQADVSEVIPPPSATLIPNARAWLRGVGNLRGQLLTLVDLKALIGDGHTAPGRLQRTWWSIPNRSGWGFWSMRLSAHAASTSATSASGRPPRGTHGWP